jgi:hypothetical protein
LIQLQRNTQNAEGEARRAEAGFGGGGRKQQYAILLSRELTACFRRGEKKAIYNLENYAYY